MSAPLYVADGRAVFKRQVDHVRPDGTKSRAMGFRVCTIDDWVDDSAAAVLAQALNHSTSLTFAALREATQARKTRPSTFIQCETWSIADWFMALIGEAGQLGNLLKKARRGDLDWDHPQIAEELADVQVYLDLLAAELGVNLGAATVRKFNAKSQQIGSPVRLHAEEA